MSNQVKVNRSNWSGEEVVVEYSDKGEFDLDGYKWSLEVKPHEDNGASVALHGDGWDDALTVIYFAGRYEKLPHLNDEYSLEKAVKRAVKYISNYV